MFFCSEEENLFAEYQQAVEDWKWATAFLEAQSRFSDAYSEALNDLEDCKVRALAAKEAYDRHAAQHGCDPETQLKQEVTR